MTALLIWTHGENSLKDFVNYLNNIHPTIKFTPETSTERINLLDTTVTLDEHRNLTTTLYNKPTDTHLFLHQSSAHPESVTHNGSYGQYLLIRRICTDCQTNVDKLTPYYLNRGYPIKQLRAHYKRVSKFTQVDLLKEKEKNSSKTLPEMVTRFNPANPNIKKLLYSNWNIIENCG